MFYNAILLFIFSFIARYFGFMQIAYITFEIGKILLIASVIIYILSILFGKKIR